jgi:hypothetical protein
MSRYMVSSAEHGLFVAPERGASDLVGINPGLVVAVRAGSAGGRALSSGYLVAERLVLTAGAACEVRNAHQPDISILVSGAPGEFSCRVAWTEPGVASDRGAVLLEVVDPQWPQMPVPTSRWGRFTGRGGWLGCHIGTSLPSAGRLGPDVAEALTGRVGPYGSGMTNELTVEIDDWNDDEHAHGRLGAGLPELVGAAVVHNGLIVGVVRAGEDDGGQRPLPAIPAARFVSDALFARNIWVATRQMPRAESLELSGWLRPWPVPRPRTPSDLLRPELGVAACTGRDAELDELAEWCRSPAPFAARAIIGGPGTGKTRLGREIAARMYQDGWIAGFVGRESLRPGLDRLVSASRPALLIVDDAETRTDGRLLISLAMARRRASPIRCIVLTRSRTLWRNSIQESPPEIAAALTGRPLLLADPPDRAARQADLLASTARDLASGLQWLPDYASVDWSRRESVATHSQILPTLGLNATHQAILAALLEDDPAVDAAEVLLTHEERRWAWVAHECDVSVSAIRAAERGQSKCRPLVRARTPRAGNGAGTAAGRRLARRGSLVPRCRSGWLGTFPPRKARRGAYSPHYGS